MEGPTSVCDVCRSVASAVDATCHAIEANSNDDSLIQEIKRYWPIDAGLFQDLERKKDCISCQDIVNKYIKDGIQPPSYCPLFFTYSVGDKEFRIHPSILGFDDLSLLPLRSPMPMLGYKVGRAYDAQQIDINLLRQWINCCQLLHQDDCISSALPMSLQRIYLVDIECSCLVLSSVECRYVALSYVWGNAITINTTRENLAYMMNLGSIMADDNTLAIPKSICDALRLCPQLGVRYLWVDSLCIVQDDEDTKKLYLSSMASIYAHAYFTIVAAEGMDANFGLRGTGRGAYVRNVETDIVRFQDNRQMVIYQHGAWHPENSCWVSRGWTFQESLFSKRILVFNGLVSWFCRKATWEEYIQYPTERLSYKSKKLESIKQNHFTAKRPSWPDIDKWADYVSEFNKRRLTYDEDVVDAFLGTTSIFNSNFSGGILWGIPEMFFDHCIMWGPRAMIRRRMAHSSSSLENSLPSWSWVGWEGDIGRDLIRARLGPVHPPELDDQTVEIIPKIRWYKSKGSVPGLLPIKAIDHSLRLDYCHGKLEKLPKDWTRAFYPDGTPYYTHSTLPSIRFRYPIPFENEDFNQLDVNQGRYLYFKAQRTFLFVGQKIAPSAKR